MKVEDICIRCSFERHTNMPPKPYYFVPFSYVKSNFPDQKDLCIRYVHGPDLQPLKCGHALCRYTTELAVLREPE
jgi:hypothetical protein